MPGSRIDVAFVLECNLVVGSLTVIRTVIVMGLLMILLLYLYSESSLRQVFKGKQYTTACDVYSLGIILWQMVTRKYGIHPVLIAVQS